MSDEEWIFKKQKDFINIEKKNSSKTKVLGSSTDGKVDLEDFEKDKAQQLWKKGTPNPEGYFTLKIKHIPKVLTANSASTLQIKGNLPLKWITRNY